MYKAEKEKCKAGKLRSQYTGSEVDGWVIRYDRQDALDFALAHLKTQRAKSTIKQPKIYAETLFAPAKNPHGLRRAICREVEKVTIPALLTCAVQNIKRLIKHHHTSIANSIYAGLKQFHFRVKILLVSVT